MGSAEDASPDFLGGELLQANVACGEVVLADRVQVADAGVDNGVVLEIGIAVASVNKISICAHPQNWAGTPWHILHQ